MKFQRTSLLLAGLVIGAALGVATTCVWFRKPAWVPWLGASSTHARHTNGNAEHPDAANGTEARHKEAHENHDGEGPHQQGVVKLPPEAARKFGIEATPAIGGELEQTLSLPGQIVLNADKVAHIVPRVAGIVRRVDKFLGNTVQAGEVMAVLESRELAEANAAYLAVQQRMLLADATLKSAEELHTKKIMPDLEFLGIRKAQVEASIEFKTADNKLHALGISEEQVRELPNHSGGLAEYELRAPFAGTVVKKHCSLGEVLSAEADAFELADLSTVWVNVTVFTQHLPAIQVGQPVTIIAGRGTGESAAVIDYISPVLDEDTRTAMARVTLSNPKGDWRPGLFVSARVRTGIIAADVLVPKSAIQTVQGENCVFIESGDGFKVRPVRVGRSDAANVEITAGLKPGERFVNANAFTLKSELEKAGFGE